MDRHGILRGRPPGRSRFHPARAASPRSGAPRRDRRRRLRFPGRSAPVPATVAAGRRPSRLRSHRKVPAWRSGSCRVSLPPAASGGRARQRFGRRHAIDPAPVEDGGHRQFVAEGDVDGLAALEAEFAALAATRPAWPGRSGGGRCCRLWPAAPARTGLGRAAAAGQTGARAAAPNPAISSRRSSGNLGLAIGPMRTIFWLDLSSCDALPRCCQKGPFFCCEGGGSCYKPAARGIAAGYGCYSRGRGGTGRRAGFRFQ